MSQNKVSMRVIPALLLAGLSGSAAASGFQLLEQGSGLGNAYAGSAAKANDASTIFWNPAGMTQLQGIALSGGVTAVRPSFSFGNQGSQVGPTFGAAGDGGDAGGWAFVPNLYASWAVTPDLYLGLGIGAPFGNATKYDKPWKGSAQSDEFDIKTININPSIAYRVNDVVSLGAGVSWQKIKADYYRQAAIAPVAFTGVEAHMEIDDWAWGWNIGALFTISPTTKVGVSYRSAIQYDTSGSISLAGNGTPAASAAVQLLSAAGRASNVQADLKVPATAIVSVVQQLSDRWEMLGDVSWTGWSSIQNVNIIRTSGPQAGRTAEVLPALFDDTWRFALGANYRYADDLKFMFGIAYDQTPVKNAETRLSSLPDNDRTWFTVGAQWNPAKEQTLEFGLAYLYIKNTPINHNSAAEGRGILVGDYDSNIWILGAQYSIKF
ncbi:OmpP1/FadL family transporter [Accumulibacter sp.]|uniref:OmpP1/FadL family transporter n=1 Tax=Accumulibacter sp. TaxID=2053492 RepID=UPI002601362E|nr:outer membrane protein transport protein [Accumulibacter sp.]MCM8595467.1 outer membrane protein transport protein [Accumulibacter sp.]MCM8626354.1 outer membrane protein transport protein [Accumulibacter sp.]MDS4049614.1 outer membrane protein transport protein [Accumulibacter sp.]